MMLFGGSRILVHRRKRYSPDDRLHRTKEWSHKSAQNAEAPVFAVDTGRHRFGRRSCFGITCYVTAVIWSFVVLHSGSHRHREKGISGRGTVKMRMLSKILLRNRRSTPGISTKGFVRFSLFLSSSLIILLLASYLAYGQGDNRVNPPSGSGRELIHYGDIVDVDVVGSLDFDWRGGLTPEGFLDGLEKAESPVFALCRTESDVAIAVADRYRRILRDPNVVVRVVDRSSRALAYVNGAVKKPHRFQIRRPVTLTELIVLSGGITDASNGEISIFRPPYVNCRQDSSPEPSFENAATQSPKRFSIKIADLLTGNSAADIRVLSGDIVSVIEAAPVFVMLDRGVPRRMNLTPELTLSRAIASAGGILKDLYGRKVRIQRRLSEPLEIDVRSLVDGKGEAPKLEPYDVIVIERKGNESARIADPDRSDRIEPGKLAKLPLRIVD